MWDLYVGLICGTYMWELYFGLIGSGFYVGFIGRVYPTNKPIGSDAALGDKTGQIHNG